MGLRENKTVNLLAEENHYYFLWGKRLKLFKRGLLICIVITGMAIEVCCLHYIVENKATVYLNYVWAKSVRTGIEHSHGTRNPYSIPVGFWIEWAIINYEIHMEFARSYDRREIREDVEMNLSLPILVTPPSPRPSGPSIIYLL